MTETAGLPRSSRRRASSRNPAARRRRLREGSRSSSRRGRDRTSSRSTPAKCDASRANIARRLPEVRATIGTPLGQESRRLNEVVGVIGSLPPDVAAGRRAVHDLFSVGPAGQIQHAAIRAMAEPGASAAVSGASAGEADGHVVEPAGPWRIRTPRRSSALRRRDRRHRPRTWDR